jgi:hypothetical protein
MTFHKGKSLSSIEDEYEELFGKRPESKMTTNINWVEKFYTPHTNVDLDKLHVLLLESCESAFVERVYKKNKIANEKPGRIKCYNMGGYESDDSDTNQVHSRVPNNGGADATVSMDQKKFCALILHPFPSESNFAIEIFSSGVLNVPGIPSSDYFEKIKRYVNDTLAPIMGIARCGVRTVDCDISDFYF